jgi:hypothetical protein
MSHDAIDGGVYTAAWSKSQHAVERDDGDGGLEPEYFIAFV